MFKLIWSPTENPKVKSEKLFVVCAPKSGEKDLTKLDNNIVNQAVYYYYNMTLSYGPMFLGWPSSNEINKDKFERRINKIKEIRRESVIII